MSAIVWVNQAVAQFSTVGAPDLCRQLGCLTNFCRANQRHKEVLVTQGLVADVSALASLLFRPNPIIAPGSKEQAQLVVSTLDLVTTLTSHCEAAKRALVKGPGCLIDTLINDVICNCSQSFKFVVPTAYR